jgi:hypothetical protein
MASSLESALVVAVFSRHRDARGWAEQQLEKAYGPIAFRSAEYAFHHTRYYEQEMGTDLAKQLLVFEQVVEPDCLPTVKRHTISLEVQLAQLQQFPEPRPLNLDPGLLQLGKFLLASTKDQAHRIYLTHGIFSEVTLRFHGGQFEPWPWTYADYREPFVLDFLNQARAWLYRRLR